jgi:hypothetical protein
VPAPDGQPTPQTFEIVLYRLGELKESMGEIREEFHQYRREVKADADRLEIRVRSLEDDRLRLRTVTLPLSVAFSAVISTLVGVLIRYLLDAGMRGGP